MLPALIAYFTKNAGLNTVTGSLLTAVGTILLQAIGHNQDNIDQLITWFSNQGEYGLYAAAGIVALRAAVFFLRGSKSS